MSGEVFKESDFTTTSNPDCMPVSVAVKSTKNGVYIGIRIGTGAGDLPLFGIYPGGNGTAMRMASADGGDPSGGGCPCT